MHLGSPAAGIPTETTRWLTDDEILKLQMQGGMLIGWGGQKYESDQLPEDLEDYKSKGKNKSKGKKSGKGFFATVLSLFAVIAISMFTCVVPACVQQPDPNELKKGKSTALVSATGEFDFDSLAGLWTSVERPLAIADSGCTASVAGIEWLKSLEAEVRRYGLRPQKTPATETFYGLGGVRRQATTRWIFPAGVLGNNTAVAFYELAGSMPGLISKPQLREWGFNWYSKKDLVDFESFGRYSCSLKQSRTGCMLLDLTDYGEHPRQDPQFSGFQVQQPQQAHQAENKTEDQCYHEVYFSLALTDSSELLSEVQQVQAQPDLKRCKAMTGSTRRQVISTVEEFEICLAAIKDPGHTFLWEVFAGEGLTTRISIQGGHISGQPLELQLGIDLSDSRIRRRFFQAVDHFKPWLLTISFPCDSLH